MIEVLEENSLYLLLGEYPHGALGGLALTLILSLLSIALVLPCALLVALARTSGKPWLELPARAYVNFIRCIPVLLIIFWVYLVAPIVLGFPISGFMTIIIAITIYQTGFLSEVLRAGNTISNSASAARIRRKNDAPSPRAAGQAASAELRMTLQYIPSCPLTPELSRLA